MKEVLGFYMLFCVTLMGFSQEQWILKKHTNNIKIYTRSSENNAFDEYKAVTSIDTSIDSILDELLMAPNYYENCPSGISHYVKAIGENQHVFYVHKTLPWPIKDRDVVTLLTVKKISKHKVKLVLEALPNEIPLKDKIIRVKTLMGYWLLEEKENKTIVTQQLFLNPEGSLPPFIVNSLLVKGPYKTFKELQKATKV